MFETRVTMRQRFFLAPFSRVAYLVVEVDDGHPALALPTSAGIATSTSSCRSTIVFLWSQNNEGNDSKCFAIKLHASPSGERESEIDGCDGGFGDAL